MDSSSALARWGRGIRAGGVRRGAARPVDLPVAVKGALLVGQVFVLEGVGLTRNPQQLRALRAGSVVYSLDPVDLPCVGGALHAGGTATRHVFLALVGLGMGSDIVVEEGGLDRPHPGPGSHQNLSGRDVSATLRGKRD